MGCSDSRDRSCASWSIQSDNPGQYHKRNFTPAGIPLEEVDEVPFSSELGFGVTAEQLKAVGSTGNATSGTPTKSRYKSLTDISYADALKLVERLRKALAEEEERIASLPPNMVRGLSTESVASGPSTPRGSSNRTKVVDLKLTMCVGKEDSEAADHMAFDVSLSHQSNSSVKKELAALQASAAAAFAVVLDLPVRPSPTAMRQLGRLVGQIMLLANQDAVKGMVPGFLGLTKTVVKDALAGTTHVRLTASFEKDIDWLQHLKILKSFRLGLSLSPLKAGHGSDSESEEESAEAPASAADAVAHDEDAKDEKVEEKSPLVDGQDAVDSAKVDAHAPDEKTSNVSPAEAKRLKKEMEEAELAKDLGDGSPGSLFTPLPHHQNMALTAELETVMARFLVSELHRSLVKMGYAPSAEDKVDPQGGGSGTIVNLLTMLAMLHNLETTLRFTDIEELFEQSPNVASYADALSEAAKIPGEKIRRLISELFEGMPAEGRSKAETVYEKLVKDMTSVFLGYSGVYRVKLVSPSVCVAVNVQGISPFPVLPSIADIHSQIAEREELALKRAKDAQALSGIEQFTEEDFAKLKNDAMAPAINPPWRLVYPTEQVAGVSDWAKVWVNESEENANDNAMLLKVQGYLIGVTPDQAFHHFYDPKTRAKWDQFIGHCQTIQKFATMNADVFMSIFATPPGIKNREFVEFRQVHRMPDNEGLMMLARSCTHPKVPLSATRERGNTIYSGYVFKSVKAPDGSDTRATIVTGLVKQDLGGYIPSFMLAQLNRRVVAEWMTMYISSVLKNHAAAQWQSLTT